MQHSTNRVENFQPSDIFFQRKYKTRNGIDIHDTF